MSAPEQPVSALAPEMPLTESVAKLVCITDQIGRALRVLEEAGHDVVLAKNHLDVDNLVTAQYIGGAAPRWVVFSMNGSGPQWVIGVEVNS
jgi:hypothetical protein